MPLATQGPRWRAASVEVFVTASGFGRHAHEFVRHLPPRHALIETTRSRRSIELDVEAPINR
jgi:hypothetical protein